MSPAPPSVPDSTRPTVRLTLEPRWTSVPGDGSWPMTVPSCDGSVTGWSLEDTFSPSARSWAVASASDEPPTDGTLTRGGRRAT